MPNFGKAFGRHGDAAPTPTDTSSRLVSVEQDVRRMAHLPQNVQNLRQGLGINSEVEELLVRKGGLVKMVKSINCDLEANERDTEALAQQVTKIEEARKTEQENLARSQRATDAPTRRVNEIEEARKTEKEELDQLRYFADMEQANVVYLQRYRQKYGAHSAPPLMSMTAISMALLPSFAGIGISTP